MVRVSKIFLVLFPALISFQAFGWQLIELDELSLKYRHFVHPGRNPIIWPEPLNDGVDINLHTSIADVFYWNSTVFSLTTPAKYEAVGLKTQLGLRLTSWLQPFFEHTSTHLLDRAHSYMPKFPVEDSVGINLILYSRAGERWSVF